MRYVTSIPPAAASPVTREVKGLSAAYAVKPVHPRDHPLSHIGGHTALQQAARPVEQRNHRAPYGEERRKTCRRANHQRVLIELRSGIDRRRHKLREGDVAEHIDIKA